MACKDIVCMPDDDNFHEWKSCKSVGQEEFVLTKVVGLTNISKNALDCNPVTGHVAFPASCMLVLLDPKTNNQKFIKGPSGKSISCVSFSDDGRLVALGEAGVKPSVSVWPLKDNKEQSKFVIDHSVGVKAIAIHPKLTYVVVIGMQDLNIGVWDYVRCQRLALTKWQTIPMSMTIPKSGSSVILCGHRKITLFNLDKINSNCYETNVFEDKKAVLLGRQSEYTFVDITSGKGKYDKSVYTVTNCGYLCEIRLGDILIDKACKVDAHAYCVRFALNHLFVGCCEGVVKICSPDTLSIAASVSLDQLLGAEAFPQSASKLYLETTALAINEKDSIVTCIYANCSIYSWQINSFTDTIDCSVLLPPESKLYTSEFDSHVTESVYRENMFRSLMGCLESNKYTRLFDSETLAARNGMRCHHDVMHLIKGSNAKNHHVTTVRFSPDGRDVICGNEAGEIKVYDASSGILRRVIEAHSAQVMCIEVLYDDDYQLVCTGGRDRIIFILNAKADFSLVQVLCDHSAAITAISLVSHDGLLTLVSAAADNLILVRRATPGNSLKFTVTGQIVESRCNKALNVTGEYIITGDKNGNIKLFKADPIFNPKLSKTLKSLPKGNQITSVPRPMCIDPTGSFIATSQNSGQIVVYHLHTGQPVASLSAQTDATAIKFTNCLKFMISSTSNGCTMIWKIPERMTEFLIAKRNKSYDAAKEVSYETTIVSCVKICKEMTVREPAHDALGHVYTGPNANHNYDTDATPSIESLSFLHATRTGDAESERNSVCSTESYLSCSTCRDSCSDTVHWCPSTDSSAMTNSGTDRFCFANGDNMCGKIIEDSECRKLGPFRQISDDALNQSFGRMDVPGLSFNSNSKTYETSIDGLSAAYNQGLGGVSGDTQCLRINQSVLKKELRDFQTKMESATISEKMSKKTTSGLDYDAYSPVDTEDKLSTFTNEMKAINIRRVETTALFTDSGISSDRQDNRISSYTTAYNSAIMNCSPRSQKLKHLQSMDFDEPLIVKEYRNQDGNMNSERGHTLNRKQLGRLSTSPRSLKRIYGGTSPLSFGSYKTACSPQPTISMDTSCSPGNSIFYSPSPCFSSDGEDLPPRLRSPSARPDAEYKEIDKLCERIRMRRRCDEMSSSITFVSNLSTIPSIRATNPGGPNESSSPFGIPSSRATNPGGPNESSPSGILSSLSASERRLEDVLLREINQTLQLDKKLQQAHDSDSIGGSQKNSSKSETPPNAPTSSLLKKPPHLNFETEDSDFIRTEMSGGNSEILNTVKAAMKDHSNDDTETVQGNSFVDDGEAMLKSCDASISKLIEEEEVYNYHSITRDESGKLRLVAHPKNSLQASPLSEDIAIKSSKFSAAYTDSKGYFETQQGFNGPSLQNIQCSMFVNKEDNTHFLCDDSNAVTCNDNTLVNCNPTLDSSMAQNKLVKEGTRKSCSPHDLNSQARCDNAVHRDYMKGMSDDKLEEYFSELRQCLQLTNSQETVYKLVYDAQDQELMELLELVLKRRSCPLMETLNLPPNEIEMYARNFTESDEIELQDFREMARDFASCKAQSSTTETTHATCRALNEEHLLHRTTKVPDISGSDMCEKGEMESPSHCPITHTAEIDGLSQNTAKALVSLVGRILTSRRAAKDQQARKENETSVVEKNQSSKTQFVADSECKGGQRSLSSLIVQQKSGNDSQSLASQFQTMTASAQQTSMRAARNGNMPLKTGYQLVLKEKCDEKSEASDSLSDASLYKTMSTLSTSRYGQVCSSRTLDSGIESSINEKLSSTIFQPGSRNNDILEEEGQAHANWTKFPPENMSVTPNNVSKLPRTPNNVSKLPRTPPTDGQLPMTPATDDQLPRTQATVDQLPRTRPADFSRKQPQSGIDALCPETTKAPQERREIRPSQDNSSPAEGKFNPPIVELFRDQDEYLRKLKEVREKFEMSIQALSKERKSRLAEEERQQNK